MRYLQIKRIIRFVLNIENLYSIGELNDEIELTTAYDRPSGEDNLIVNARFTVIDEVHECIELFDKLGFVWALSDSFDERFCIAEILYRTRFFAAEKWHKGLENIKKPHGLLPTNGKKYCVEAGMRG